MSNNYRATGDIQDEITGTTEAIGLTRDPAIKRRLGARRKALKDDLTAALDRLDAESSLRPASGREAHVNGGHTNTTRSGDA